MPSSIRMKFAAKPGKRSKKFGKPTKDSPKMKLWRTLTRRLQKFALNKPRVVPDTNVLVSATIIPHGAPALILAAATDARIVLIVSDPLLTEYLDVIQRPRILQKYRHLTERLEKILELLRKDSIRVVGEPQSSFIAEDPKDDFLIASALEGKAAYIISGDEHLLALREYRGIKILTPRDFVVNVLRESIPASH